jgi:hypothetical protein
MAAVLAVLGRAVRPEVREPDYWRQRIVGRLRNPTPGMLTGAVYITGAVVLMWFLLLNPTTVQLSANPLDQQYFEWQLAWVQHALFHFENPMVSHALNVPYGVNVAANPQILFQGAALAPFTALFGAGVSFALLMTFNFAATAIAWRWFLLRNAVTSQTAAFVGGLFCGFAPAMTTHTLGHPNLAAQWLVPVIVDRVFRLRSPERLVRNSVILGILITAQVFIGEELLLLTAVGLALFVVFYAAMKPSVVRRDGLTFLQGSSIAVGVAVILLAYPLWIQFKGPQSFVGIPYDVGFFSADLKSYLIVPNLSLLSDPNTVDPLVANATEQAALIGRLVVIAALASMVWCIRSAAVRASAIAVVILVLLSLGANPKYDHKPLPSPFGPSGLWALIQHLPVASSSLPMRMAMAVTAFVGFFLAVGVDKAMGNPNFAVRGLAVGAVSIALIPLIPRVYATGPRDRVPAYITDGKWKSCMPLGHTLVTVPVSDFGNRIGMVWQTAAHAGYDIPQGAMFVRDPNSVNRVMIGPTTTLWTASWLIWIHNNGGGPGPITPLIRSQVASDMKTWNAGCVVVADDDPHLNELRTFLDGSLSPGTENDGMWVWRAQGTA